MSLTLIPGCCAPDRPLGSQETPPCEGGETGGSTSPDLFCVITAYSNGDPFMPCDVVSRTRDLAEALHLFAVLHTLAPHASIQIHIWDDALPTRCGVLCVDGAGIWRLRAQGDQA